MADHDRIDPGDAELAAVSAALDDEGPMPPHLSAEGRRFAESAAALRRSVRVSEAEPGPDLRTAVLRQLHRDPATSPPPRRPLLAVAAAFVLGVAVAGAFLLDRGLHSPELAAAELSERILVAQTTLTALDADVVAVEQGAHPDVPTRRYEGRLQWRTPERLSLGLHDVTELPVGWSPNDIAVVVDEGTAWRTGRRACPVDDLPGCLGPPVVSGIEHRAPFSAGWAAPLDLLVPVGAVVAETADIRTVDGQIVVATTVGRARTLVDAILHNGAFRQVHADDRIEIRLDEETLTLRGFSIVADATTARAIWATTWGYDDATGDELFRLDITTTETAAFSPGDRPDDLSDAGFRDDPELALPALAIPDGFAPHRRGVIEVVGAAPSSVVSWVDGRAWITLRTLTSPNRSAPAGTQMLEVGGGVVHVDQRRNEVVVLTESARMTLSGSVGIDDLIAMAASFPEPGRPADADADASSFTIDVAGTPGLVELSPGTLMPPPDRGDVVGVVVRGNVGRHSPTLRTLTWVEAGTVVVLSADAELTDLLAAADQLVLP